MKTNTIRVNRTRLRAPLILIIIAMHCVLSGCGSVDGGGDRPVVPGKMTQMRVTSNRGVAQFSIRHHGARDWQESQTGDSVVFANLHENGRYELRAEAPGWLPKIYDLAEPQALFEVRFDESRSQVPTPSSTDVVRVPVPAASPPSRTVRFSANRDNTVIRVRRQGETVWQEAGVGKIVEYRLSLGATYEVQAEASGKTLPPRELTDSQSSLAFVFPEVPPPQPIAVAPATPARGIGNRWAVAIGISRYQHAGKGGPEALRFADKDAKDFAAALEAQGWSPDNICVRTNEQATKREIEKVLETWLQKAGDNDLIVLFWSSHGWPDASDPEKAYFGCYDTEITDPSSAYRMDKVRETLAERKARNVVFIADACHSGTAMSPKNADPKAIGVVPALESWEKRQQLPKGWIFVTAADPDRKAYENASWSNGALTHALLEGLREAKADGYKGRGAKDGVVTLGELESYVTDRMGEESLRFGCKLLPRFYSTSTNPEIWDLSLKAK